MRKGEREIQMKEDRDRYRASGKSQKADCVTVRDREREWGREGECKEKRKRVISKMSYMGLISIQD